ncbi:U4/U6-U5 snRNP complex subunit prp31 [Coniochaeta pulveracea]|uniref:U4/U6-U5 snRNP complex subunit prp31 n=1 Tax=Coniochaeta pulveracea TaxID=177199 RepID=A0A420Y181_9PEZI|nr:U4/U6-U5 snRNP complex subunit prp31 [Coniochaeta pulveracea]
MATLADELLNDFEDTDEEAGNELDNDGPSNGLVRNQDGEALKNGDVDMADGDEEEDGAMDGGDGLDATDDPEETKAKVEKMQLGGVRDVRSVAHLMKTLEPVLEVSIPSSFCLIGFKHDKPFTSMNISPDSLCRTLQKIAFYQSQSPQANDIGNVEDHPEYELLTQANTLSTQIDSEIVLVHKFIRDHYSVRFDELQTLVTNPLDYAKVVAILGNGPFDKDNIKSLQNSTDNPLGITLKSVLDGPTLMVVTVEATHSQGQEMAQEDLARTIAACQMVISLDNAKKTLTEYVQSRMNFFAPNLTALIGSLTAAQLLNTAGGLTGLSKTPSCNLAAWGSKKQANVALATNTGIRQQGYIFQSEVLRTVPMDLKKQAMRMFANKIVLCARSDCFHQFRDGSEGERLKEECLDRLDKLQAKPDAKNARALPAPDEKLSRKRGGRRARKAKEATAMTELRKAQNRMAFGKEEKETDYGVGDGTVGLGMIGQPNTGNLRAIQIDNRTRAKLSQKSKGWGGASSLNAHGAASSLRPGMSNINLQGKGLRTSGVGTTLGTGSMAGTVSSLAFTPMQGIELVDPKVQAEMNRKRKADEDRWFKGGTFTQVAGGSVDSDGFKKPMLPPAKRVDTGATKK